MSLDPSKRARFGVSKVRTGCNTCKSRHLKCDEDRPSCRRCIKGRRECRRPKPAARELEIVHYVARPVYSLTAWPSLDEKEQRLFHVFRFRTGPELAGVHNPEFWLRYIMHMSNLEPAIKHAVFGLTILHQRFTRRCALIATDDGITPALREYTTAITILTESIKICSFQFPDTALVACVLFCAFESISYHLNSAISHAKCGIKIFSERRSSSDSSSKSSIPASLLTPLYTKLDTQGLELGETSFVRQQQLRKFKSNGAAAFKSIDEAQESFDELTNSILHIIYDIDSDQQYNWRENKYEVSPAEAALQDLARRYCQWCHAFDNFVLQRTTSEHLAPCLLLQIWRTIVMINLRVNLRHGEMDFDRFYIEFKAIVDLAFAFILTQSGSSGATHLQNMLSRPARLNEKTELHHSKPTSSGLRGGYLGIHAQCTPLILDDTIDSQALQPITKHLLRISRSSCQHVTPPTAKTDDANALSCDLEPSYCFSPGIVSPLYVTISRCRDPHIRRRALALMQRCKRREGLWDADLAARLGQRVIEIEEHRAQELDDMVLESSSAFSDARTITFADQIPNEARVRMIKPTFLPDRRSIERYYLGWPVVNHDVQEVEEVWIEELLEW